MATEVYLPLRSNIGWFSEQTAIERFERLLKVHIALFDHIILEDGTYSFVSDGNGQGWAWMVGPDASNRDRTKLTFYPAGGSFGLDIGGKVLMKGQLRYGCEADYLPVLHRAGLRGATYFRWSRDELVPEVKCSTDQLAEADAANESLAGALPEDRYLKKELLKGFYRDAVLSSALKASFAVDHHLAAFVAKKRTADFSQLGPSMPLVFYDHWLKLNLPDFAGYTWAEIHELHESPAGSDFRRMIERLSLEAGELLRESPSKASLDDIVDKMFSQELVKELRCRRTGLASTGVNLALNLVPYGSAISAVKGIVEFGRDSTSWVSLL